MKHFDQQVIFFRGKLILISKLNWNNLGFLFYFFYKLLQCHAE